MTQTIAILGRQPALGLAELESLYGSSRISPIGQQACLIDLDPDQIAFSRLGGTVKLAKLLTILDTTNWAEIEKYLLQTVAEHAKYLPAGKMNLGLSLYDLGMKPPRISATGLELKKVIKATGRSVRVIPNKTPELSSAQVLHNHLTGERAWELLFIRHGNQTYLAQTTEVQDITAYSARDQARPKRDARVGMLPPKLAQIIINLALGPLEVSSEFIAHSSLLTAPHNTVVLDPFCGTGVILQEALLMGMRAYGSDIELRMIEYSQTNLDWLAKSYRVPRTSYRLESGDATAHLWQAFDTIACETYLGRPFSALPKPEILREVMQDVDLIHKKFLKNVARQTKSGFRMCMAIPAWNTKFGFTHLKILDNLGDLGYTRLVFKWASSSDLIYHREGQIVGRELVVLVRQ